MTQLFLPLCVACLALVFTSAAPPPTTQTAEVAIPDRCDGIEFDAITPDEQGNHLFFKDGFLWKGFRGPAQRVAESFSDLGRVDAAFRMHREGSTEDHDHVYLFQDEMVFRYFNQTLQDGFPKKVEQEFPGVPCHLDAAVECPKGECSADSVLFFKGSEVHHYDVATRTVKKKEWPQVPPCTSVLRWMEHYYCFQGNNFTRFHPVTGGVVGGVYPKDARAYFMTCPNVGGGYGGAHELPACSEVKFDAVTSDNAGRTYYFTGSCYQSVGTGLDDPRPFPITRTWPEVAGGVDAAFSYQDKMYLIKGDQVFIYLSGAHYSLIEGYPKTLQEELGVQGPVDAAFACPGDHTAHIIQGGQMRDVDLSVTPSTVTKVTTLGVLPKADATLCGSDGLKLFTNTMYIKYRSKYQLSPDEDRLVPGLSYIVATDKYFIIDSSMKICSSIHLSNPF
ncbi:hemopexin-like [Gadus chalcogrammus]|uniref:hemopexin-like n=1 Tax=Gadus chalcogrammus TaxID=1042646 RepID=UPI0024C2354A|nr:hemopexin-like [Gadus chalcogrammus]